LRKINKLIDGLQKMAKPVMEMMNDYAKTVDAETHNLKRFLEF
jgi:hypothetical protein